MTRKTDCSILSTLLPWFLLSAIYIIIYMYMLRSYQCHNLEVLLKAPQVNSLGLLLCRISSSFLIPARILLFMICSPAILNFITFLSFLRSLKSLFMCSAHLPRIFSLSIMMSPFLTSSILWMSRFSIKIFLLCFSTLSAQCTCGID